MDRQNRKVTTDAVRTFLFAVGQVGIAGNGRKG